MLYVYSNVAVHAPWYDGSTSQEIKEIFTFKVKIIEN